MAERKPLALRVGAVEELGVGDTLPLANVPVVVASQTHAATAKTTPVDADEIPLVDSATSNGLKRLTWANLKAALQPTMVVADSGSSYTIDLAQGTRFNVTLTANCAYAFPPALAGKGFKLLQKQDATGSHTPSWPANVRWPGGVVPVPTAAPGRGDRYSFEADGTYWLGSVEGQNYKLFPDSATLPDDNAVFSDEGDTTSGWTASNATLSSSGSWLRQTKTAGGSNSSMTKTIGTFTPTNRDWILYGSVRSASSSCTGVIWILNEAKEISLWLGSANADSSSSPGSVSMCGTVGTTRNVAVVASGLSYSTTAVEFALQYDSKFGQLVCWFRESDGRWKFKARVACDWFSSTSISALTTTASAAGSWIEIDYLSLCKPNIVAIGDSICEGKTLFSPNRTLGLTNDESSWQRHAVLFPSRRNNLIVNKGVGGQTSTQILDRIAEATGEGPRLVILHASSNDEVGGVSQSTRTSNIQSSLNAITAAGQQAVLLNAMYGTSGGSDNTPTPDLRDYMTTWWATYAASLSGSYTPINIMSPLIDGSGFMQTGLTQSDGIHPTAAGYEAVGNFIESALAG